jgi:nitroimidazol reductase NimA-like FMN-containing flavoprotein (pyridoxamine 5'-phosphate oxidase superfamily)
MEKFPQMRRKGQQLTQEETVDILLRATSGVLALHGAGGYPYAVPLSYVYEDGRLYFHSALAGHKIEAIKNCAQASFCVVDQDDVIPEKYTTLYRSVIAFGQIHIVDNESEKLRVARMLGNRYNPNNDEALQKELQHGFNRMLVLCFDIEHLTGKESIELIRTKATGGV